MKNTYAIHLANTGKYGIFIREMRTPYHNT